MKIISWNVNGIRAILNKGFLNVIEKENPDILCLQEIKAHPEEVEHFNLVNVYTPNSQRGLTRLKHRLEWDKKFLNMLKNLESKKPEIFCGDLNVAHKEIDIARPKDNVKNAGFT